MMWLKHYQDITRLCVTGLPERSVIKTPISGKLELCAFDGGDKGISVVDSNHDHNFTVYFHSDQLIHNFFGNIKARESLITITDPTNFEADRRTDFRGRGGTYRAQLDFTIGDAEYDKRGDWISFANILRDKQGRLVFMRQASE